MNAQSCYSSDQLDEYARCRCSTERSQEIEQHLEQCEACQSQFAQIVDAGVAPEFLLHGRSLHHETVRTLEIANASAKGETAVAIPPTHSTPDAIGQYQITGCLGHGGMGIVYSAWDELLKRPVALKLLHRHNHNRNRALRMLQEAAALGRLSHPNIVRIYEVLSHESQPVLSMELVEGQNLAKWLDGRRVDPRVAAELILKLAGALHYAHSKGVVHRDLKPANVMLEFLPTQSATLQDLPLLVPKITDFGLAKLVDESMMTNTGDMLGTPAYMAPEQAAGNSQAIGPSVDIYALGVILYELLTGRPPFVSESLVQVLSLVQNASPTSPRFLNPEVPKDLETICLKCLEKQRADRYQSSAQLGDDLGNFLEGRPVTARPLGALARCWRWAGKHRMLAASLATSAALLIAVTMGSWLVANRESKLRWELERRTRETELTRIEGLVMRLVSAEPMLLSAIIKELHEHPESATIYLSPLLSNEPRTPDEHRAKLHARIASVARDASLIDHLAAELTTCKLPYIMPIREQLRAASTACADRFKTLLRDEAVEPYQRFRAALALAEFLEPLDEFWKKDDFQLIVEQLLVANTEHQPVLRDALRPISKRLLEQLETRFGDPQLTELQRLGAANALADFALTNKSNLSRLLAVASSEQFNVLYGIVADQLAPEARGELCQTVATTPPEDLGPIERIEFGQHRANAAVTLLRLGDKEHVMPII